MCCVIPERSCNCTPCVGRNSVVVCWFRQHVPVWYQLIRSAWWSCFLKLHAYRIWWARFWSCRQQWFHCTEIAEVFFDNGLEWTEEIFFHSSFKMTWQFYLFLRTKNISDFSGWEEFHSSRSALLCLFLLLWSVLWSDQVTEADLLQSPLMCVVHMWTLQLPKENPLFACCLLRGDPRILCEPSRQGIKRGPFLQCELPTNALRIFESMESKHKHALFLSEFAAYCQLNPLDNFTFLALRNLIAQKSQTTRAAPFHIFQNRCQRELAKHFVSSKQKLSTLELWFCVFIPFLTRVSTQDNGYLRKLQKCSDSATSTLVAQSSSSPICNQSIDTNRHQNLKSQRRKDLPSSLLCLINCASRFVLLLRTGFRDQANCKPSGCCPLERCDFLLSYIIQIQVFLLTTDCKQ